jgi:hypothetical protein
MNHKPAPSFAFAKFNGRSKGEPATWVCFFGTFSIAMNQPMVDLLIDAIDKGGEIAGDEIELDDDVCELVDALENAKTTHLNGVFRLIKFKDTYTVQCGLEGLKILDEAVRAGADLQNQTLYAFLGECEHRIEIWDKVVENWVA